MDDSETSSLSSAPASGDEKLAPIFLNAKGKLPKKKALIPVISVPPPRIRTPSPEREETLVDNPDIAFIVMFRSRFSDAFPAKLAHLGPQDIERGVVDTHPSAQIEDLLCALLGILLNRKKPVERGHHGRALEEAMSTQRAQWPRAWRAVNPLSGSRSFTTMTPSQRLDLLRQLILWSLSSSEQISNAIKDSYKQTRHDDDMNQPLAVQPWGKDSDKRAFFLIEGQDDTSFRVYREADRSTTPIWRNVAGTIDEIKLLATKLEKDTSISARQMAKSIHRTIPRFEATEEKRRRREYRQQQRSRFSRPEPGFSLYEGRTRGKRMRYTFDDDDEDADELSLDTTRRSGRQSDRSTAEPAGPVVTASGRQVKARGGGLYGETVLTGHSLGNGTREDTEMEESVQTGGSRSRRSRAATNCMSKRTRSDDEDEHMSDGEESGSEGGWNSAENEEYNADHDHDEEEEDDEMSEGEPEEQEERSSVMVVIKLGSKDGKDGPNGIGLGDGGDDSDARVAEQKISDQSNGVHAVSADTAPEVHAKTEKDSVHRDALTDGSSNQPNGAAINGAHQSDPASNLSSIPAPTTALASTSASANIPTPAPTDRQPEPEAESVPQAEPAPGNGVQIARAPQDDFTSRNVESNCAATPIDVA